MQTNVQVEVQSSRLSVVCDLAKIVIQKTCERQCFIILELSCEFLQMSCTVLYEINVG
jgi:hypothetical protein